MECRGNDKELDDEGLEPDGSMDSSDRLAELLQVGSWTNSPQHPTGGLEITEANGD